MLIDFKKMVNLLMRSKNHRGKSWKCLRAAAFIVGIIWTAKVDGQIRKIERIRHKIVLKVERTNTERNKDLDSLHCKALTINDLKINTKIEKIDIKKFELRIPYYLLGRVIDPVYIDALDSTNNEWKYLPIRVLLGR